MNVFLVLCDYDYDSNSVYRVCSSKEAALVAMKHKCHADAHSIEEWEIDGEQVGEGETTRSRKR